MNNFFQWNFKSENQNIYLTSKEKKSIHIIHLEVLCI